MGTNVGFDPIVVWMKRHRVRFPSFTDVLAIAKSLGYWTVAGADGSE